MNYKVFSAALRRFRKTKKRRLREFPCRLFRKAVSEAELILRL